MKGKGPGCMQASRWRQRDTYMFDAQWRKIHIVSLLNYLITIRWKESIMSICSSSETFLKYSVIISIYIQNAIQYSMYVAWQNFNYVGNRFETVSLHYIFFIVSTFEQKYNLKPVEKLLLLYSFCPTRGLEVL